jgi:23S rRNA pseudouridine1911/1915/1917 synthase
MKLTILYEDEHIIALDKPCGILSQSDQTGNPDILTLTKSHLLTGPPKSATCFLGLVHRLDKPVSGVMVFAKNKRAAALLNRQFIRHTIRKTYIAIIEGFPGSKGNLKDHLVKDDRLRIKRTAHESESGARYAELEFIALERRKNLTCVEIHPKTGRSHQIRLQFAERGYPIAGDRRYGSTIKLNNPEAIALWAQSISFAHPKTGRRITIESNKPSYWPWDISVNRIAQETIS